MSDKYDKFNKAAAECLPYIQHREKRPHYFVGWNDAVRHHRLAVAAKMRDINAEKDVEIERLKSNHCKDCCCGQVWKALGISLYTGMSIAEHVSALRAELEKARDEIALLRD